MSWQEDKKWSDQYMTEIKRILGEHLIMAAPLEDDQERNTDLIVLKFDSVRIAVRLRREGPHMDKYINEFTIRSRRPSGTETELAKILSGWGNYFFYGFGGNNGCLLDWHLGNLNVFRLWYTRELLRLKYEPGREYLNTDRSSFFRVYRWKEIPGFEIASSKPFGF